MKHTIKILEGADQLLMNAIKAQMSKQYRKDIYVNFQPSVLIRALYKVEKVRSSSFYVVKLAK